MDWSWEFPYDAQRAPVMADGVVCTSQPLAARAGLAAMESGGNAADAALAAAITLTVVEPVMNGLGSDVLALISTNGRTYALNGSGRAPAAWNRARFAGQDKMPAQGWDSVTVPGAVAAWAELSDRFGQLPFEQLFVDAKRYAREGFIISPVIARQWANQVPRLIDQPGFAEAFVPDGLVPGVGERFRLPGLADSLARIAETRGQALYHGPLAETLVAHAQAHGGVMSVEDLASHQSDWTDPVSLCYRTITISEMPPNAQGLAVLVALGILQHFDLSSLPFMSVRRVHLQVEAMKIAFREVYASVADADVMTRQVDEFTSPAYLQALAGSIDPGHASPLQRPPSTSGGTVYVAAADREGMIVSFIQSNYQGFGSGIVVPGTGVSLHNRGAGFSLDPAHDNCVAGGKRPFHTILPALLSRGGTVIGALGVVGANMQPQGQVQIISGLEDYGYNPQTAIDAPRWRIFENGTVTLEHTFGETFAQELMALGHKVELRPRGDTEFGGAQLIHALDDGGYFGASDSRRDGAAYGY
ncbi:MAG: gamma-glutamyltransferase family protein [Aquisalimonadaceae bacterium]